LLLNSVTDTEKVIVRVNHRVATVEMNRPENLNALDLEMLRALVFKLKEVGESDEIDIVVLTGNGRAFSSGGDINWLKSHTAESEISSFLDGINELIMTLYGMSKITISAVSGAAAGLGFSIALATDYIIADQSSKFAMNFIGIGLIPDGGGHFFLEKRIGETKAKQLIWEGKKYGAEEALQMGLIQEVAKSGLQDALDVLIMRWLNRPVQAMIRTKKILAEKNRPQLLKVLELEKYGQIKMRESLDHKEGIQAFLEKRNPRFRGK
jgi:2-(1,2-epoxy-1,2-dihydrophenyl)acetyl-CoA isomerase